MHWDRELSLSVPVLGPHESPRRSRCTTRNRDTRNTVTEIIQPLLEIPDDIALGLRSGDLVRLGGVVRDNAGRLVTLLDDASPIENAQEAAQASIARILRKPNYVLIGLGVVAVAATAGRAAYLVTRKTKAAQPELPMSVESYSASLAAYLEAARHGTLDAEIIDRLIADLDAVKAESDSGTITIAFLPEQWETLVGIVAGHTRTLAEANQLELSKLPEPGNAQGATIIALRPYLEVQRELFSRAM
jgi:hypothetical protein